MRGFVPLDQVRENSDSTSSFLSKHYKQTTGELVRNEDEHFFFLNKKEKKKITE